MIRTAIITGVFCVVLLGIIFFRHQNNQYQVYIPHVFNGEKIVKAPGLLNQKHQHNVMQF